MDLYLSSLSLKEITVLIRKSCISPSLSKGHNSRNTHSSSHPPQTYFAISGKKLNENISLPAITLALAFL